MFIKIKLRTKISSGNTSTEVYFPINVEDLKIATEKTYLNLGTQYAPIRADNFIQLGGQQLPNIVTNTKITVSLSAKKDEDECKDPKPIPYNGRLICCKVKNVGKGFNNADMELLSDEWKQIFNWKENLLSAPDGTLYISPEIKTGKCKVQTKEEVPEAYLAYSVLFCFRFDARNYYFLLDPVIKVSSNRGDG